MHMPENSLRGSDVIKHQPLLHSIHMQFSQDSVLIFAIAHTLYARDTFIFAIRVFCTQTHREIKCGSGFAFVSLATRYILENVRAILELK